MHKPRPIITAILLGLTLSGCASSPWSAAKPATAAVIPQAAAPTAPATATNSPTPAATTQAMQDIMAELRDLGVVDPAARDRLMEDLRQTDPNLWPLVMQQFRATAAYRRKAMEKNVAAVGEVQRTAQNQRPSPVAPPIEYPTTSQPAELPQERRAAEAPGQVIQASYTPPMAVDWRLRLAGVIEALEKETPAAATTPSEVAQHARLRMLYLAAGRRDDAQRPIPADSPAVTEFWSKELAGLGTWLDVEHWPDDGLRAAECKPMLTDAIAKLSEAVPLVVRNLAFCTEVQSFGCTKRFDKYEFRPNQEVLLYAELENFASQQTARLLYLAQQQLSDL